MKLYGIVGHPVAKSLSPAMHKAAIGHFKLDADYRLFDIDPEDPENLANFCYETELHNIGGFSVTMPYKETIMAYMDHYDPLVKIIGAMNTVVNENGKLIGYNTDATGAAQALREKTEIAGKKILLMGAGGAARAIAYALKELGADIHIYNRTAEKAQELADALGLQTIDYRLIPQAHFDILINATPIGSPPDTEASLLHADQIPAGSVVMDIITHPIPTRLLKEAEKAGAKTVSGERMLLYQAIGQFRLWFNVEPPLQIMEQALYEELKKRK